MRVTGIGSDSTENHQVLAIGYEAVDSYEVDELDVHSVSTSLKVSLYDPNFPGITSEIDLTLGFNGQINAIQRMPQGAKAFYGFFFGMQYPEIPIMKLPT